MVRPTASIVAMFTVLALTARAGEVALNGTARVIDGDTMEIAGERVRLGVEDLVLDEGSDGCRHHRRADTVAQKHDFVATCSPLEDHVVVETHCPGQFRHLKHPQHRPVVRRLA